MDKSAKFEMQEIAKEDMEAQTHDPAIEDLVKGMHAVVEATK